MGYKAVIGTWRLAYEKELSKHIHLYNGAKAERVFNNSHEAGEEMVQPAPPFPLQTE